MGANGVFIANKLEVAYISLLGHADCEFFNEDGGEVKIRSEGDGGSRDSKFGPGKRLSGGICRYVLFSPSFLPFGMVLWGLREGEEMEEGKMSRFELRELIYLSMRADHYQSQNTRRGRNHCL